ncbi:MAG: alpha/beta fold hydrolase [Armatimonadota bacterium]
MTVRVRRTAFDPTVLGVMLCTVMLLVRSLASAQDAEPQPDLTPVAWARAEGLRVQLRTIERFEAETILHLLWEIEDPARIHIYEGDAESPSPFPGGEGDWFFRVWDDHNNAYGSDRTTTSRYLSSFYTKKQNLGALLRHLPGGFQFSEQVRIPMPGVAPVERVELVRYYEYGDPRPEHADARVQVLQASGGSAPKWGLPSSWEPPLLRIGQEIQLEKYLQLRLQGIEHREGRPCVVLELTNLDYNPKVFRYKAEVGWQNPDGSLHWPRCRDFAFLGILGSSIQSLRLPGQGSAACAIPLADRESVLIPATLFFRLHYSLASPEEYLGSFWAKAILFWVVPTEEAGPGPGPIVPPVPPHELSNYAPEGAGWQLWAAPRDNDTPTPNIILIHGFTLQRVGVVPLYWLRYVSFWGHGGPPISRDRCDNRFGQLPALLSAEGYNVWQFEYEGEDGNTASSIETYAAYLERAVEVVKRETGAERLSMIAHSMGGVIARAYIQYRNGYESVDRLVTLGTPHFGCFAWGFLPDDWVAGIAKCGVQLRPYSSFLWNLNTTFEPEEYGVDFACIAGTPGDSPNDGVVDCSSARLVKCQPDGTVDEQTTKRFVYFTTADCDHSQLNDFTDEGHPAYATIRRFLRDGVRGMPTGVHQPVGRRSFTFTSRERISRVVFENSGHVYYPGETGFSPGLEREDWQRGGVFRGEEIEGHTIWSVALPAEHEDAGGPAMVCWRENGEERSARIYVDERQSTVRSEPLTDSRPVHRGPGLIAFVSDRDGSEDIWVMNADGSNPRNLTRHPATDWDPAWSPDGSRIAFTTDRDGNWEVYMMNADGSNQTNLTNDPANDLDPHWSPDGAKIAFNSNRSGNHEIWVMDVDGSNPRQLTDHPGDDGDPVWSPDGSKIAFHSERAGPWEIYTMNADGTAVRRITTNLGRCVDPWWSPDGSKIAFGCWLSTARARAALFVINADGSNLVQLTDKSAWNSVPTWSPDGSAIAFYSDRDGNFDIFVMNADGSRPVNLTHHPAKDWDPAWCPIRTHPHGSPAAVIPGTEETSPNGQRRAWAEERPGHRMVWVIDGQPTPEYTRWWGEEGIDADEWIKAAFSVDLENLPEGVTREEMLRDWDRESRLDGYLRGGLRFSPDSQRVAYIAGDGPGKMFVVVDGKRERNPLKLIKWWDEGVSSLEFSPDSKHLAYVCQDDWGGAQELLVIDGVPQERSGFIEVFRWSPNSKGLYYVAHDPDDPEKWWFDTWGLDLPEPRYEIPGSLEAMYKPLKFLPAAVREEIMHQGGFSEAEVEGGVGALAPQSEATATLAPGSGALVLTVVGEEDDGLWLLSADGATARELRRKSWGLVDPALAPAGDTMAVVTWDPEGTARLEIMTLAGEVVRSVPPPEDVHWIAWSPSGEAIALAGSRLNEESVDLWLLAPLTGQLRKLSSVPGPLMLKGMDSAWAPDSRAIAVVTDEGLFIMNVADGAVQTAAREPVMSLSWAPDGKQIAFDSNGNIEVLDVASKARRSLVDEAAAPAWSPDGTRIAFMSDEEVWVSDADGSNRRCLTDRPGVEWWPCLSNQRPGWSPDGTSVVVLRLVEGTNVPCILDARDGAARYPSQPNPQLQGEETIWVNWVPAGGVYLAPWRCLHAVDTGFWLGKHWDPPAQPQAAECL